MVSSLLSFHLKYFARYFVHQFAVSSIVLVLILLFSLCCSPNMDHEKLKTVCSWDSACIIILIIHLQTTPICEDCEDLDPVITVHYATADAIDNCLALATFNTVGPANGVPRLARGIGSTTT